MAPGADQPAAPRALLRLATAGSVDDGKSTLVGRLRVPGWAHPRRGLVT